MIVLVAEAREEPACLNVIFATQIAESHCPTAESAEKRAAAGWQLCPKVDALVTRPSWLSRHR